MTLVYVGGADLETAAQAFDEAGFAVGGGSGDRVITLDHDAAATLRAADERGERYVLVHVGEPDREPGGSYERAHHRVAREELPDLARRLRTRDRLLVRCLDPKLSVRVPTAEAMLAELKEMMKIGSSAGIPMTSLTLIQK